MANIREILAENMKKHRQKLDITQPELAERANISTNFIGMIEQKRKFPAPEMLERIAKALEIEPYELFAVTPSPQNELEQLRREIKDDIKNALGERLEQAIADIIKKR